MTDLMLGWDADVGTGDIRVAGADLATDGSLQTAVLISLFTDRRAPVGELPYGVRDRRGWWADALADGDETGSLLWTLTPGKETAGILVRAESHASEALAWLVDDGHAETVSVSAAWEPPGAMTIGVDIRLSDGSSEEVQFSAIPRGPADAV